MDETLWPSLFETNIVVVNFPGNPIPGSWTNSEDQAQVIGENSR